MALTKEQLRNAETIIGVGRSLGASSRDIQIALMTALVESNLINVPYGDRDSLGLFQQRSAWGTAAQRLDPQEAAHMFFTGGHGGQRGLFDFHNRNQMTMGQAAQAVQVSAYPDRYAQRAGEAAQAMKEVGATPAYNGPVPDTTSSSTKTLAEIPPINSLSQMQAQLPQAPSLLEVNGLGEVTAGDVGLGGGNTDVSSLNTLSNQVGALQPLTYDQLTAPGPQPKQDPLAELKLGLGQLGGTATTTSTTTGGMGGLGGGGNLGGAGDAWRAQAVKYAHKFLGTKYVWGGAQPGGFDCSGLIYYIYNHLLGFNLPRVSYTQATSGKRVPFSKLMPGDLVAIDNNPSVAGADHIGIYVGHGMVIQAPHPGGVVELTPISDGFAGGFGVHISHR